MKWIVGRLQALWRWATGAKEVTRDDLKMQRCRSCGSRFFVYDAVTTACLYCPKCGKKIRSKEYEHVRL